MDTILKRQPIQCLVVDDEPIACEGIAEYINKVDFLEIAATCPSAFDAAACLREKNIDLMFLDINMPYLSGLDFLESLDAAPLTIFTTAYSEYALEGFRLQVVDYLLKPFPFKRFNQAVLKARQMFQSTIALPAVTKDVNPFLYVRQGETFQKIIGRDILFAESMQNYIKLHFKDRTLVIHQTMASLEETLSKAMFFRIHKCYLVNVFHIDSISGGRVFIGKNELPVSRQKKNELLNAVVYKNLINI